MVCDNLLYLLRALLQIEDLLPAYVQLLATDTQVIVSSDLISFVIDGHHSQPCR